MATVVAVGADTGRAAFYLHEGKQGSAERAVERVVRGTARRADEFRPLQRGDAGRPGRQSGGGCSRTAPQNRTAPNRDRETKPGRQR